MAANLSVNRSRGRSSVRFFSCVRLHVVPELIEVERYRTIVDTLVGAWVIAVSTPDAWFLKERTTSEALHDSLVGRCLVGTERIGKLLLLHFDNQRPASAAAAVLGIRFGMTGRALVDGVAGVDDLLYTSNDDKREWDRFVLRLRGADRRSHELRVNDPRRLGGVALDPDRSNLGPDACVVTARQLRERLRGARAVKAALLDQSVVAGIGNLLVDEILWAAAISPKRTCDTLLAAEQARIHAAMRRVIRTLTRRGGSHLGPLCPQRGPGGCCPKDGTSLSTAVVGGRTTWWCPRHQR